MNIELLNNAQLGALLGGGNRSIRVTDLLTDIEYNVSFAGARNDHYDVTPTTENDANEMLRSIGGLENMPAQGWVARPVVLHFGDRRIAAGLNTFMHHIRIGGGNPGARFPSRNEQPPWTRWGGHICLYVSNSVGGAGGIDSTNRHARAEANQRANTPRARGRQARAACHEAHMRGTVAAPTQPTAPTQEAAPPAPAPQPAPAAAFNVGDIVQFSGGGVFVSSTAATPAASRGRSVCKLTRIASGAPQPFHLISEDGARVHGWVMAQDVTAINEPPAAQPATAQPETPDNTRLLEVITHWEARGEDEKGQILVVNVINNRVAARSFPNNIHDVIFAPGAFTPATRADFHDAQPNARTINAVQRALNGEDFSQGATFFHSISVLEREAAAGRMVWHERAVADGRLIALFDHGNHRFYREV